MILLATGGERLPVFHDPGFFPLYIVTEDKDAQTLFDGGANSLLNGLERFQDLPFVDFAADIVVLDVSSFSTTLLGGVVTEAVRILAQQGVLFVLGAADFNISDFSPQAAKLVLAGSYAHSFVRRVGVVPDLPVCKDVRDGRLLCLVSGAIRALSGKSMSSMGTTWLQINFPPGHCEKSLSPTLRKASKTSASSAGTGRMC